MILCAGPSEVGDVEIELKIQCQSNISTDKTFILNYITIMNNHAWMLILKRACETFYEIPLLHVLAILHAA